VKKSCQKEDFNAQPGAYLVDPWGRVPLEPHGFYGRPTDTEFCAGKALAISGTLSTHAGRSMLANVGSTQMGHSFAGSFMAAFLILGLSAAVESSWAQTRKPTANELSKIRDCAVRNSDNVDEGERQCVFKLVADPCIGRPGRAPDTATVADCYRSENSIWDGLLNENYKTLLGTLDEDQAAKAREMQRAWLAYRDTTCQFYDDKIQGSMAVTMHAACIARESARRAMLLKFFGRL
jgi:uncharacterized protein YecT (DUF1311 family)